MPRAFMLIEILLAFAVAGMIISGIADALYGLPASAENLLLEHGALVEARTMFGNAYESITSIGTTTRNQYSSALYVEEREDESVPTIRALVSWRTSFDTPAHLSLEGRVIRPNALPGICDSFVSSGWKTPVVRQTHSLPGSYHIRALAASPSQLIVAADSLTTPSVPTLFFFQATGMSSDLSLKAAFDNASTSRIGYGAIATAGKYTYAGNAFGSKSVATCSNKISCAQVHVFKDTGIDVKYVASLSLATSSLPFARTSSGETAPASALFYYNNYLYIGLEKTAGGNEFNIIDMHDPAKPVWVSGYSVGRSVNHITVRGSYAYVSTDHPSRELIILDITNPEAPVVAGEYDAPGGAGFGYGTASLVRGAGIRLGRTYSSNASELLLLEAKDLSDIHVIREENVGTTKDPESVKGMASMDTLTFTLLTHRLQFWDTSSGSSLQEYAPSYQLPDSSIGAALACRGGLIYVARNSASGVGIIDVLSGS